MSYTVHEVAELSGVTIKTLYHYHKIGLLMPESVAENGYRYYGDKELKRLQQILFYRELDFSLEKIKAALDNESNRLRSLSEQYSMLKERASRLAEILGMLEETIQHEQKGVPMSKEKMFKGLTKKEWVDTIEDQNEHLQKKYNYEIDITTINVDVMNEKASEAAKFMSFMAESLKNGVNVNDNSITEAIETHINYMQKDMNIDASGFAAQTKFLMTDDFHRQMIEAQQTGLSYYICFSAENYASK